jgi:hypothetical protein
MALLDAEVELLLVPALQNDILVVSFRADR